MASRLTGIPFAFTGRAGDIYPQDGLLREKSADALFIRTNNHANVNWLRSFCPSGQEDKVHAIYNSLTFTPKGQCAVSMARQSSTPIKTFSIGFSEASYDESRYARIVARAFSTDHHERVLSAEECADTLPGIISRMTRRYEQGGGRTTSGNVPLLSVLYSGEAIQTSFSRQITRPA